MYSETSTLTRGVKNWQITETEILKIINERQNRTNVKCYSVEETYELLQKFIPKI
jgi:hypothetical protein